LILGVLLAGATQLAIKDCTSFGTWFNRQPAAKITLQSGSQKYPAPRSRGALQTNFSGATTYKGNVGGGGCLGGWYDAAHALAAIRVQYDTYQDILIFRPASAPSGLASKDLAAWRLSNGVRLGMTRNEAESILGAGKLSHSDVGTTVRYEWMEKYKAGYSPVTYEIALLYRHGILTAIDYGYGV
jgi:hypothetical protein